jgi:hypothetical protein
MLDSYDPDTRDNVNPANESFPLRDRHMTKGQLTSQKPICKPSFGLDISIPRSEPDRAMCLQRSKSGQLKIFKIRTRETFQHSDVSMINVNGANDARSSGRIRIVPCLDFQIAVKMKEIPI